MIEGVDWTEAVSLEESCIKYFEARKTDSSEFKALLAYYGKKRMAELYEKWVADKKKEVCHRIA